MDDYSLTTAFNEILEDECQAILDVEGEPLRVVVPLPPQGVEMKAQLDTYLENNDEFVEGMSHAAIFGCGR